MKRTLLSDPLTPKRRTDFMDGPWQKADEFVKSVFFLISDVFYECSLMMPYKNLLFWPHYPILLGF